MSEEIKNRIGEFILSGQVLREDAGEGFMDGGGEGPSEGSPQAGDSLQTLESTGKVKKAIKDVAKGAKAFLKSGSDRPEVIRDKDEHEKKLKKDMKNEGRGALPPSDNHRASYAHPTQPQGAPASTEADFQADDEIEDIGNPGKGFGKKTEKSLWDRDDYDVEEDDNPDNDNDPQVGSLGGAELNKPHGKDKSVKEGVDVAYLNQLKQMSLPELEKLNQETGEARKHWSGNKADPYYAVYLQSLKKGKMIQMAIKMKQGPRDHTGSVNPIRTRAQANRPWGEALDPKVLIKKMVERGLTDAQIRQVMKTQFGPVQKKN